MQIKVRVTFEDGTVICTRINLSLKEAREYYLNNEFQFGDTEERPYDYMLRAIKVEDITPPPGKIRIWQLCHEEYLFPKNNYYNPIIAIRKVDSINMSPMLTPTMIKELSKTSVQVFINCCCGPRWINAHDYRVKMVCK